MPLLHDDEMSLRQRFADVLPGYVHLGGFPPGWAVCLEKFLTNLQAYNATPEVEAAVSIRKMTVYGLVVRVTFNNVLTNNKDVNFIRQCFKRHIIHTCKICSVRARIINPVTGLAFCISCFELVQVAN